MRPRLLHPTSDIVLEGPASHQGRGLVQDLALQTLIDAMAAGDGTIARVAGRVLLDPLTDLDAIRYRQRVLRACLERPAVPRALYAIAVRTLERRKKVYWGLVRRTDAIVHHGIELINLYYHAFRELRGIADAQREHLGGDGLGDFLARLRRDLDDAFLAESSGHLKALRFRAGVQLSARLGPGNAGCDYVLERPALARPPATARLADWWRALIGRQPHVYTYRLPPHEDTGIRALSQIQARGLGRTANAIAQACEDLLWFFRQLRGELAFYVGCINLHERFGTIGAPICFPEPLASAADVRSASDLHDASLALTVDNPVVGNDVAADGADLIVITGANQGGKTTFLRSVGSAQLMMQSGMFVPARTFRSSVTAGLFTHFTREEDAAMRRGRLDDELARLDDIVSAVRPGATLLLNESFASTNAREGSELASGIVRALTEAGVRVLFVTHLTRFARELFDERRAGTLFLHAERRPDGTRTFRMIEGPPAGTSHGSDLYPSALAAPQAGGAPLPEEAPEPARGD